MNLKLDNYIVISILYHQLVIICMLNHSKNIILFPFCQENSENSDGNSNRKRKTLGFYVAGDGCGYSSLIRISRSGSFWEGKILLADKIIYLVVDDRSTRR